MLVLNTCSFSKCVSCKAAAIFQVSRTNAPCCHSQPSEASPGAGGLSSFISNDFQAKLESVKSGELTHLISGLSNLGKEPGLDAEDEGRPAAEIPVRNSQGNNLWPVDPENSSAKFTRI